MKNKKWTSEKLRKLFDEMSEWEWCDAWKDDGNRYAFQSNKTGEIRVVKAGKGSMEDALEKLQKQLQK